MAPLLVLVLSEAKSTGNVKVIEEYEGRVGQSCPGKTRVALRTGSRVMLPGTFCFTFHFYPPLAYIYVLHMYAYYGLNHFNKIFYLHKLNHHQISLILINFPRYPQHKAPPDTHRTCTCFQCDQPGALSVPC